VKKGNTLHPTPCQADADRSLRCRCCRWRRDAEEGLESINQKVGKGACVMSHASNLENLVRCNLCWARFVFCAAYCTGKVGRGERLAAAASIRAGTSENSGGDVGKIRHTSMGGCTNATVNIGRSHQVHDWHLPCERALWSTLKHPAIDTALESPATALGNFLGYLCLIRFACAAHLVACAIVGPTTRTAAVLNPSCLGCARAFACACVLLKPPAPLAAWARGARKTDPRIPPGCPRRS